MPNISDIFNGDAFNVLSLTRNINNIPYKPSRIEELGIYDGDGDGAGAGVNTQRLAVVNVDQVLQVIPDTALGTMPNKQQTNPGDIRYFTIPHLPLNDNVMAWELQGQTTLGDIGSAGDSQQLLSVQQAITNKQGLMVQNHMLTWEWMRMNSIKGILLDADGSTVLYNWFTEFGVTPHELTWTVATEGDINTVCDAIVRHTTNVLGNDRASGIHCFVGSDFMTALKNDPALQPGFLRYPNEAPGALYRESTVYGTINYNGITFEEYRGLLGGNPYVAADEAYAFPLGTNAFIRRNGPGDLSVAQGTMGMPMYSSRKELDFGTGWGLHSQSNPMFMCQRPGVLTKISLA